MKTKCCQVGIKEGGIWAEKLIERFSVKNFWPKQNIMCDSWEFQSSLVIQRHVEYVLRLADQNPIQERCQIN